MQRFAGKCIVVVGASSGIGLATAHRLAREGAKIVAVARDAQRLAETVKDLPGTDHVSLAGDAACEQDMRPLIALGRDNGGFDGLAMCAGTMELRPLAVLSEADIYRALSTNLVSALITSKITAKAAKPTGASIVWLSSGAALRGSAGFAAYAAAKGGLLSAARALAIELAGRRIRINTVIGGIIRSPMSEAWLAKLTDAQRIEIEKSHPLGLGEPADASAAITFLLSDESRWMTGSELTLDGGFCAK